MPDSTPAIVRSRSEFGIEVRTLRLAAGLSQEDAAERAGIHRTYWSSLERGQRNVGIDNVFKIATALDVTPARLFGD